MHEIYRKHNNSEIYEIFDCSYKILLRVNSWVFILTVAPPVAAPLVVRIYPERVLVPQGNPVTLRCQVSGSPPHYFFWSREDGQPISGSAERHRQGTRFNPFTLNVNETDMIVYCIVEWWYICKCEICVCRSRAVLHQRPAKGCRCLHLHLPRPAQH